MKLSRQQAVDAKCKDCIYDELDAGTWRAQVTACESTDCPLYEYRPLDAKAAAEARKKRYNEMSEADKILHDKRAKEAGERLRGLK